MLVRLLCNCLTDISAACAVDWIQNRRVPESVVPQLSTVNNDSQGHLIYKDGDILQARCTQNFSPTSTALRHI